jgi:hypothetical protein
VFSGGFDVLGDGDRVRVGVRDDDGAEVADADGSDEGSPAGVAPVFVADPVGSALDRLGPADALGEAPGSAMVGSRDWFNHGSSAYSPIPATSSRATTIVTRTRTRLRGLG